MPPPRITTCFASRWDPPSSCIGTRQACRPACSQPAAVGSSGPTEAWRAIPRPRRGGPAPLARSGAPPPAPAASRRAEQGALAASHQGPAVLMQGSFQARMKPAAPPRRERQRSRVRLSPSSCSAAVKKTTRTTRCGDVHCGRHLARTVPNGSCWRAWLF